MSGESESQDLSMMEAVNILSNMSEIDVKNFSSKRDLEDDEEADLSTDDINWKDPRQALLHEPIIRETFRVLHRYLQNMVRKDQNILKDNQTLKGIQALMLLAQEGASKMDRFAKVNLDKHKPVSGLKEYTDLQKYYKQHILKQTAGQPEQPEDWEEDLQDTEAALEVARKGLSDLEVVRRDEHYELFYIQNENKKRYFNRSLLRHIRLIGNFDEFIGKVEGEDPLLQLREVLDREMYEGAQETLKIIAPYVDEFYKEAKIEKDKPLVWNMNKALMALRMAANSKNLIENQSFKSCLEYYSDFHRFLRLSMESPGYVKRITGEIEEDQFGHTMLRMTHVLCCQLFMRKEPQREGIKLIHSIIQRGDELLGHREKPQTEIPQLQVWQDFRDRDACIRHLLKHYPNGPILRILDSFREEEEFEGFDPLMHRNFPNLQYNIESDLLHLSVLRMACPTKQVIINKAEIAEEFRGFLRFYKHDLKSDKHLIVNVQNRTSWEEFTRCKVLEDAATRAETYDQLYLLGLSVGTPFYNQEDEYESMGGAPVFIEQFAGQMLSVADCGYFLPVKLKMRLHEDFIKDGMALCHKVFFDGKSHLSRRERLNFILIFYLMFTLRVIDLVGIDSVSFSCKDAIDTGTGYSSLFYVMMRLVSNPEGWTPIDQANLEWYLYSPALFIRERPIQQPVLNRTLMAIEQVHKACAEKGQDVGKALSGLYDKVKFPFKIT